MDSEDEEEIKPFDLESLCKSLFMIWRYSSLDFAATIKAEACDF